MEDKEFDLESKYDDLVKKYNLPDLKKISEDFDIDKNLEKDSFFLIREIRRIINEKISAYLRLFETFVSPSSPPMFVFSILRNISDEDKESIRQIYQDLAKIQIEVMKLEALYQEEEEAKFIKRTFERWQEIKKEIYKVIKNFECNLKKDDGIKKRSYFG